MNSGLQANTAQNPQQQSRGARLVEVALLFTKLGFIAFGGPAAHLSMMEDEVVRRREWIDRQHFLDLVAAMNLVPGPTSTEVAINLGLIRAGCTGMFVAGACFIGPAMLIILPIAWAYQTYGKLPQVAGMMAGVNAAVVAVVAAACLRFGRTAVKDGFTGVVLLSATAAEFLLRRARIDNTELIVLAGAAFTGIVWSARRNVIISPAVLPLMALSAGNGSTRTQLLRLVMFFLKIGATLFGSGYVLVSYLQGGLVGQHRWLTDRQLLDAISIGQVTPGPLLTTATFIGYVRGYAIFGTTGGAILCGVLATIAIFLPAFAFVAVLGQVLPMVRHNRIVRGALDSMNAGVVALIAVAAFQLGSTALRPVNAVNVPVTAITFIAIMKFEINATWFIVLGALAGWAARAAGVS